MFRGRYVLSFALLFLLIPFNNCSPMSGVAYLTSNTDGSGEPESNTNGNDSVENSPPVNNPPVNYGPSDFVVSSGPMLSNAIQ